MAKKVSYSANDKAALLYCGDVLAHIPFKIYALISQPPHYGNTDLHHSTLRMIQSTHPTFLLYNNIAKAIQGFISAV